ncbi:LysM domain-containing protein [Clostridium intestinale]|uniref:LysM peptidoglycan-binding domain-containing protein n=1 Tax=Clostridium intestinale TaxID=36845 RepID=UPI002DD62288|nr:LysM domain-containing protein [Clostridium intestinale]WRY52656.1 LysM domain-containing protein [Clostridium intestinale]
MQIYNSEAMATAIFLGIKKAFNIQTVVQPKDEGIYHVVKKGDNLWTLSKIYFTTVKDLIALNNIENPDLIYPGQRIRVK